MRTRFFGYLAVAIVVVPLTAFQSAPVPGAALKADATRMVLQADSKLWITGTSTVRDYECKATEISGEIAMDTADPGTSLTDLELLVTGARVAVPVAGLDCSNDTMNEHMRKALKAEENPTISFNLGVVGIAVDPEGAAVAQMTGQLDIAGQDNAIIMDATVTRADDGTLLVQGTKEIDMTEWGMEPPKLMLGMLKVNERVTVHFEATFRP